MVVQELITLLGFDIEDKKLEEFTKAVDETKNHLLAMGATVLATGAAIFAMVKTSANTADEIKTIAMTAGVAVEELQRLGYAGKMAGAGIEEVGTGLKFLNKNVQEAIKDSGGDGAKAFRKMGIQLKDTSGKARSATDIFLDLSNSFQTIDPGKRASTALTLLGKSGGGLVEMLSEGPDKLRSLMAEADAFGGIMSKDDIERLGEFNDSFDRTISLVGFLKNMIALELAPEIIEVMESFREWLVVNKDIIKSNLIGFFKGLTTALKVVFSAGFVVLRVFTSIWDGLGIGKRAVTAFTIALGLLWSAVTLKGLHSLINVVRLLGTEFLITWAKALGPYLLLVAAIALVLLAVEDLFTYLRDGGDSYTGDMVAGFKGMWDSLKQMAKDEGLSVGKFLGDAVSEGFISAIVASTPSLLNLAGKVFLKLPGIKFMQTDFSKQIDTESWRKRDPMLSAGSIGGNSQATSVTANTTINVGPGVDPVMVGERVEGGVKGSLQEALRIGGRQTAPATE